MKKLALGAILGASLMISSSAFALTAMTDANMKSATGQAGVSIAIDNVQIEQYVGSTTYTDTSGVYGNDAAGIKISDKHTFKTFLAMVSADDYKADFGTAMGLTYNATDNTFTNAAGTIVFDEDLAVSPTNVNPIKGAWVKASALSIDVGTCAALTAGLNDNAANIAITAPLAALTDIPGAVAELVGKGYTADEATAICAAKLTGTADTVAGVVIGLPTLLIKTSSDEYSVGVTSATALNNGKDFIKISKGASAMAILGGTVEIAAH